MMLIHAFSAVLVLLCLNSGICAVCAEPGISFCPQTYAYILQAEKLGKSRDQVVDKLAACGRDLIVIDAFFEEGQRWSREDIVKIRAGKAGRKVVCYFSIGEAEDYRPYWQAGWNLDRPDFLLSENPNWPGNFRVRYWNSDWQQIMLEELQQIMSAGFDGVMLDIVDGFEFFEIDGDKITDNKQNPQTGNTYRRDMAMWVKKIADTAREKIPGFLVIPQNGAQLMAFDDYRNTVSAQALESLFTNDNKIQPAEHTNYILSFLRPFMDRGGTVLLTEYCTKKKTMEFSRRKSSQYGVVLLQTNRALSIFGSSYAPEADSRNCGK